MPLPLAQSFVQDLTAMGFEEVPVTINAAWHDFQHGSTVIRFWENVGVRAAWSHIVYARVPGNTDDVCEVIARSGSGLTRLAVYLHGAK